MKIHARFFIRTDEHVANNGTMTEVKTIMASEMQMHYGGALERALIDQKGRPGMSVADGLSRDMYDIPPQIHGYDFQDMYNEDVIVDLAGKVVQAYHF